MGKQLLLTIELKYGRLHKNSLPLFLYLSTRKSQLQHRKVLSLRLEKYHCALWSIVRLVFYKGLMNSCRKNHCLYRFSKHTNTALETVITGIDHKFGSSAIHTADEFFATSTSVRCGKSGRCLLSFIPLLL